MAYFDHRIEEKDDITFIHMGEVHDWDFGITIFNDSVLAWAEKKRGIGLGFFFFYEEYLPLEGEEFDHSQRPKLLAEAQAALDLAKIQCWRSRYSDGGSDCFAEYKRKRRARSKG